MTTDTQDTEHVDYSEMKKVAENSWFYKNAEGLYLRMDNCDGDYFWCHDDFTEDAQRVYYEEVTDLSQFMTLVPINDGLMITKLADLCHRALLALNEDDFPQLREELRVAIKGLV